MYSEISAPVADSIQTIIPSISMLTKAATAQVNVGISVTLVATIVLFLILVVLFIISIKKYNEIEEIDVGTALIWIVLLIIILLNVYDLVSSMSAKDYAIYKKTTELMNAYNQKEK